MKIIRIVGIMVLAHQLCALSYAMEDPKKDQHENHEQTSQAPENNATVARLVAAIKTADGDPFEAFSDIWNDIRTKLDHTALIYLIKIAHDAKQQKIVEMIALEQQKRNNNHIARLVAAIKTAEGDPFEAFSDIWFSDNGDDIFAELDDEALKTLVESVDVANHQEIVAEIKLEQQNRRSARGIDMLQRATLNGNAGFFDRIIEDYGLNYDYGDEDETATAFGILLKTRDKFAATLVSMLIDKGARFGLWDAEQILSAALTQWRHFGLARYALDHGANAQNGYSMGANQATIDFLYEFGGMYPFQHMLIGTIVLFLTVKKDGKPLPGFLTIIDMFLSSGFCDPVAFASCLRGPDDRRVSKTSVSKFLGDYIRRMSADRPLSASLIAERGNEPSASTMGLLDTLSQTPDRTKRDLSKALLIAAGRGYVSVVERLIATLDQAQLLVPELMKNALAAAVINNKRTVARIMIKFLAKSSPKEYLTSLLRRFLRPLIMRGDREFVEEILELSLSYGITFDLSEYDKLLTTLGDSHISDARRNEYQAIRDSFTEYHTIISPGITEQDESEPITTPDREQLLRASFRLPFDQ